MPPQDFQFVVGEEDNPARVDKYLGSVMPDLSRNHLQKLIEAGTVLVNGHTVKSHRRVVAGDIIALQVPEPVALDVVAQNIPIEIIFEDENFMVLNKQPGIVVHPAPGHLDGTIVNALMHHTKDLSAINGVMRPGIVHRLDKDTSGCLVVAKNDIAHHDLAAQFESRRIQKEYMAIVHGRMVQASGSIDFRIGRHPVARKKMAVRPTGREAKTFYETVEQIGGCSLLLLKPTTGRTHQLRVHLTAMGFPILGDQQYGRRRGLREFTIPVPRQMLHAFAITLHHPTSHMQMRFEAPVPQDMEDMLGILRNV